MKKTLLLSVASLVLLVMALPVLAEEPFVFKRDVPLSGGWESSDPIAGTVDCFQYYSFSKVTASFDPSKQTYAPGEKVVLFGGIMNQNDYPVVDGYLFARLVRKNEEFATQGHFIAEEKVLLSSVVLDKNEKREMTLEWVIPDRIPGGAYEIDYFYSVGKKFNLGGLPFSNEIIVGRTNFTISGNQEAVEFDRSGAKVNGNSYQQIGNWIQVAPGSKLEVVQPLKNTFDNAKEAEITYDLYYWDSLDEKDKLSSRQEKVMVPAGGAVDLRFTIDKVELPVYYLKITSVADGQRSVINLRMTSDIQRPRLNYPAITKFPVKKGEPFTLFTCFHNTSNIEAEGRVEVAITDLKGREIGKTLYSGKISSAPVAIKSDIVAKEDLAYIKLVASAQDNSGKEVDRYEAVYDCSNASLPACVGFALASSAEQSQAAMTNEIWSPRNTLYSVGLVILILGVAFTVISRRRNKQGGTGIYILLILFSGLTILLGIPDGAGAKTTTVTRNYDHKRINYCNDPTDDVRRMVSGIVNVTHDVSISSGSQSMTVGNAIGFTYDPIMTYNGFGGAWDTPVGTWCNAIDGTFCWAGAATPENAIQTKLRYDDGLSGSTHYGFVHWTGVKASVSMTSSNPAVVSCSGMTCTAVAPGSATLTANIGETPTRIWSRAEYRDGWEWTTDRAYLIPGHDCDVPGSFMTNYIIFPADSLAFNVDVYQAPAITLTAAPNPTATGGSTTVTWSTTGNPTSCTGACYVSATGAAKTCSGFTGAVAASGSYTYTVNESTRFDVTCSNPAGSDFKSVTVTMVGRPVSSLTATPDNIEPGESTTLAWSASSPGGVAMSCRSEARYADTNTAVPAWPDQNRAATGSSTFALDRTADFRLYCADSLNQVPNPNPAAARVTVCDRQPEAYVCTRATPSCGASTCTSVTEESRCRRTDGCTQENVAANNCPDCGPVTIECPCDNLNWREVNP